MSAIMPADRSFHLIEAVPDRMEGAPVARRRRWLESISPAHKHLKLADKGRDAGLVLALKY